MILFDQRIVKSVHLYPHTRNPFAVFHKIFSLARWLVTIGYATKYQMENLEILRENVVCTLRNLNLIFFFFNYL